MDDFCAIKARSEESLRPEWESRVLGISFVDRTRDEVDTANQQWRHAISLKEEQGDAEAVPYCRDCLARELARWPRGSTNQHQTFLVRCCFVQLIRIWAADILKREDEEKGDEEEEESKRLESLLFDDEPVLIRCVEDKHGDAENLEVVMLVLRFCLRFLSGEWTKSWAFRLLPRIEECLGPWQHETVTFVQYLAESIMFNTTSAYLHRDEIASIEQPQEQPQILERHLRHLEEQTDKPKVSSLCFRYSLGRQRLSSQNEEEASLAKRLINGAFKGRAECFGESHAESETFISELLDEFYAEQSGKHYSRDNRICGEDPHEIITDLLRHCYKNERLAEAEVLVHECLSHEGVLDPTGPGTGLIHFHEGTVQFTVASHNAPGNYIYWEDSRTYLRRWACVTLEPASPPEFFPAFPVQLVVWPDRIDITLSTTSRDDLGSLLRLTSEEEILREIRSLTVWSYLELMQTKGILWDFLESKRREYRFSRPCTEEATATGRFPEWPSTIWLFPELYLTSGPLSSAVSLPIVFVIEQREGVSSWLTRSLLGVGNGSLRR